MRQLWTRDKVFDGAGSAPWVMVGFFDTVASATEELRKIESKKPVEHIFVIVSTQQHGHIR